MRRSILEGIPIKNTNLCRLALTLLLANVMASNAQVVYKSVDENGVVSFSDTAPTNNNEVETLEINTPQPGNVEEYNKQLEDMRETTDRMVADREAREKHRAEMLELQASRTAAQLPAYEYPLYPSSYSHRSSRSYRHTRPPYYPGYKPTPVPPIYHPPLRPVILPYPGSNAQLMRPLVSGPR
ncbi:MAG: DUF4124 domain-containing protein [Halioglobus sp.]